MMAKRNLWSDGRAIVQSDTWPGEFFYPVVSNRRVRGSHYYPYSQRAGSAAWVREANHLLAGIARSNFEAGKR